MLVISAIVEFSPWLEESQVSVNASKSSRLEMTSSQIEAAFLLIDCAFQSAKHTQPVALRGDWAGLIVIKLFGFLLLGIVGEVLSLLVTRTWMELQGWEVTIVLLIAIKLFVLLLENVLFWISNKCVLCRLRSILMSEFSGGPCPKMQLGPHSFSTQVKPSTKSWFCPSNCTTFCNQKWGD